MSKYGVEYNNVNYKKRQKLTNDKQRSVFTSSPNQTFAIDLIFYGGKIFMNIIDVFTRKLWTIEVADKTTKTLLKTLNNFFIEIGTTPNNLWTDGEGALASKEFQTFAKKYRINTYQTYGVVKNPVVERVNRTQKENVEKDGSSMPLMEKIEKFNKIYNETSHSSTGQKPNDIYGEKIKSPNDFTNEQLMALVNGSMKMEEKTDIPVKKQFKVGQKVKVLRKKGKFEKGYTKTFNDDVYTIERVDKTKPVTYILKDSDNNIIQGGFYHQELMLA